MYPIKTLDGVEAISKRTTKEKEKQEASFETVDPLTTSFYDLFDHSMYLYFSFWGPGDIQEALQEVTSLQNPIIASVSIGEKKIISSGIDKMYNGDRDASKSKRMSGNFASSATSSNLGLLPFITTTTVVLFQY